MDSLSREVLEKVERGELTPEEGAARMAQAARQFPAPQGAAGQVGADDEARQAPPAPEVVEDFESVYAFWRSWWVLPLSLGALVFVLGAVLIAWGNQSSRMFWAFCGTFPLLLGLAVMFVSFWSRTARWVHVRIRQQGDGQDKKPRRIAISLPIPAQLIGWGLKTFGDKIPGLREKPEVYRSIPEIMDALEHTCDPLTVEVNEPNGDEVRVYIL